IYAARRDTLSFPTRRSSDLELVDGVDQTEDPIRGEVVLVDRAREAGSHSARHELDQGRIVEDQALAHRWIARGLELLPQVVDVGKRLAFQPIGHWDPPAATTFPRVGRAPAPVRLCVWVIRSTAEPRVNRARAGQ